MVFIENTPDLSYISKNFCHVFGCQSTPPTKKSDMSEKVLKKFPRAITNSDLVAKVTTALKEYGYGKRTLVATSLCCDEVNRVLERDFGRVYGNNFTMGGLAGFPFGGVTSFGAMAHHIPDHGSCLIIFGPHVGIDRDGNVGSVNRRGRNAPGVCCGSACAALNHVESIRNGTGHPVSQDTFADPIDAQQAMVGQILLSYSQSLSKASEPMVQLPMFLFEAQTRMMEKIVALACQEVHGSYIALLGGIQINTPEDESDYFLPMSFEIRTSKNEIVKDLLWM